MPKSVPSKELGVESSWTISISFFPRTIRRGFGVAVLETEVLDDFVSLAVVVACVQERSDHYSLYQKPRRRNYASTPLTVSVSVVKVLEVSDVVGVREVDVACIGALKRVSQIVESWEEDKKGGEQTTHRLRLRRERARSTSLGFGWRRRAPGSRLRRGFRLRSREKSRDGGDSGQADDRSIHGLIKQRSGSD